MNMLDLPADPQLRPERAAADKDVIGEAVRAHTTVPSISTRRIAYRPLAVLPLLTAAALLLVVTLFVSPLMRAPVQTPRATTTTHVTPTDAPAAWELVSDVSPTWQVQSGSGYESGLPMPGPGLVCPTSTTCYAANVTYPGVDRIEVTHDGGTTWQQSPLPVAIRPSPLACVDADTCAILGIESNGAPTVVAGAAGTVGSSVFLETTDGGQTWTSQPGPGEPSSFFGSGLACTSATSCVAITSGGTAFTTADAGSTWTSSPLPSGFVSIALQCRSTTSCIAIGPSGIIYSTDGGTTWSEATAPAGASFRPFGSSLSCAMTVCLVRAKNGPDASDGQLLSSSDGGRTWTALDATGLPQGVVLGLSCTGDGVCWASGVTTAGGSTSAINLGNAGLAASTSDGGSTWQTSQLPEGIGGILDVSCPSVSQCYALAAQQQANGTTGPGLVLLAYGAENPAG
jgi:photosystem II stability/assembly factor-like uncharacterized protein